MKIDIFTEFNKDLKNIWLNFEKNAVMTPFQSFSWLSLWQKTVGEPLLSINPQIVHLQENGQSFAILPFAIRKTFGIHILEWMGGHNTDYMGPLIHPEFLDYIENLEIWKTIDLELVKYDVIHFQKQSDWILQFFERIGFSQKNGLLIPSFKTSLPSSWNEYFDNIKKRLRTDSKRQYRRLEKLGDLRFIYAENSEEKSKIIRLMIAQKSRQYRETKIWNMLSVEEYQYFYKGLADLFTENFKVHCSALQVDNVIVATHVGIFNDSTFYYLMPANERDNWKKYSPGRLLLLELLKWSIENKLKFFDFTIGDESYKNDWCNINTKLFGTIKSNSFLGFVYIISLFSIQKLKKIPLFRKAIIYLRKIFYSLSWI